MPQKLHPPSGFSVVYAACRVSADFSLKGSWFCSGETGADASDSFIPSHRLEQEAHRFGLRERALPFSWIGSPQHTQIRSIIL